MWSYVINELTGLDDMVSCLFTYLPGNIMDLLIFCKIFCLFCPLSSKANPVPQSLETIDLTHPVSNELTIQWPTSTKFNFTPVWRDDTPAGFYYESNDFSQNEHAGTHLDAPAHFARGRWRVGDIPLSRLSGPAVVVNFETETNKNLDALVQVSDLRAFEAEHGRIPDGAVVLFFTGHGKHYGNRTRYLGYPPGAFEANPKDTANLHFPGLHAGAAAWLTKNRYYKSDK